MIIETDCDKMNFSSNINEVIRPVLNFLFFLRSDFTSTKSTKKHQKALKNTTNLRFIKLKKHLSGKIYFFTIRLQIHKVLKSTKKH